MVEFQLDHHPTGEYKAELLDAYIAMQFLRRKGDLKNKKLFKTFGDAVESAVGAVGDAVGAAVAPILPASRTAKHW